MTVLSNTYLIYERGRKMRRDGRPCPPKPPEENDGRQPEDLIWIGYRVEMMLEFERRKKVAAQLNMPEPEWREEPWPT